MFIECTNKGCYASEEQLLDPEENEVYCVECGETINVPPTTKALLKSLGQIKKAVKSGIQYTCKSCNFTGKPLLKKMAGTTHAAYCRKCDAQLDVHPSFIQALKLMKEEYGDGDKDGGSL